MQNEDCLDGFRLVACDRHGDPAETLPDFPPAIAGLCQAMAGLHDQLGYAVPWTGYVAIAGGLAVGVGAFVGPAKANRAEIAYFTLPDHEGRGFAGMTTDHEIGDAWAWLLCPPPSTATQGISIIDNNS